MLNLNLYFKDNVHIAVEDHNSNACLLIELMFLIDENLSAGEFGKTAEYKDLEFEIERIRHLKPKLIPVIVGALDTVKKDKKYLEQNHGFPSLTEMQKIVLSSIAHLLRKSISGHRSN